LMRPAFGNGFGSAADVPGHPTLIDQKLHVK
jgi:hypothetical protein